MKADITKIKREFKLTKHIKVRFHDELLAHFQISFSFFPFRELKFGKQSFVLSSARDVGALQSIEVQFKGSRFFLKKVIVFSKVEDKR